MVKNNMKHRLFFVYDNCHNKIIPWYTNIAVKQYIKH